MEEEAANPSVVRRKVVGEGLWLPGIAGADLKGMVREGGDNRGIITQALLSHLLGDEAREWIVCMCLHVPRTSPFLFFTLLMGSNTIYFFVV